MLLEMGKEIDIICSFSMFPHLDSRVGSKLCGFYIQIQKSLFSALTSRALLMLGCFCELNTRKPVSRSSKTNWCCTDTILYRWLPKKSAYDGKVAG